VSWKAFFWNHRSSWANMFSGLAISAAGLQQIHPTTAIYIAFVFNALGVVLNTFPDISNEQ